MTYDVIVIGSGPGGYSAAVRAGQYGLKTALVEKDPRLGGTCLLVGCIPTKAFLHAADVWERFQNPEADGMHCDNPRLDLPMVSDRKNTIVDKHSKGVEYLMKKNKVDVIKGRATIKGPGRVEANGQVYETKEYYHRHRLGSAHAPRACSRTRKRILTNIEILDLREVPKTMGIIGAGAVGVEFASCFHRFGTQVTVFEMLPRIVPLEDEEVSKELERLFKKSGIRVETGARVENVQRGENGVTFTATFANGKTGKFRRRNAPGGRRPQALSPRISASKPRASSSTADSSKSTARSERPSQGFTPSATWSATTPQLAHVATAEGMIAIAHIAGKPFHADQ